jgi:hypothetical protein
MSQPFTKFVEGVLLSFPLHVLQMSQTFAKFVEGMLLPFTPARISNVSNLCKICGRNLLPFTPACIANVQTHGILNINTSLAQFLADTASTHYTPHMWEPCP